MATAPSQILTIKVFLLPNLTTGTCRLSHEVSEPQLQPTNFQFLLHSRLRRRVFLPQMADSARCVFINKIRYCSKFLRCRKKNVISIAGGYNPGSTRTDLRYIAT